MDGKSLNITQEKLNQLKQIFPEVFKEEKIDFLQLKALLGGDIIAKERHTGCHGQVSTRHLKKFKNKLLQRLYLIGKAVLILIMPKIFL